MTEKYYDTGRKNNMTQAEKYYDTGRKILWHRQKNMAGGLQLIPLLIIDDEYYYYYCWKNQDQILQFKSEIIWSM
jgi:hypothetical protein